MPSLSPNDLARITDYVAGELTSEEQAQTGRWIAEDGERTQFAESLRRSREVLREEWVARVDVEGNVRTLMAKVARREAESIRTGLDDGPSRGDTGAGKARQGGGDQGFWIAGRRRGGFVGQPLRRTTWYVTAGLIVSAIAIITGWRLSGSRLAGNAGGVRPTYTTYVTANGQRATVVLPDGNIIALNTASRLEVPENYSAGHHTVRLPVGEALFTVSHHTEIPFVVAVGSVTTRVLGTSFLVRHYSTDTTTSVAVYDGKVSVGSTALTAQQLIKVDRIGRIVERRSADSSQFSFTRGILVLNSISLAEAAKELSRWYDVDIRLGNSRLTNRLVYGRFTGGSTADLSEVLAWTLKVRVVRTGRVLTLYETDK